MTPGRGLFGRAAAVTLLGLLAATVGCVGTQPFARPGPEPAPTQAPEISVPPPGTVPRELEKVTLPEYVIEPPDVLRIEVGIVTPAEDLKDEKPKPDANGNAPPAPTGPQLRSLPLQPVWGDYTVRPDGTVYLGLYGSVKVAGYTLEQAAQALRQSIARQAQGSRGGTREEAIVVILDVVGYNSKNYYVILDGGGYGEQVFKFPITGSETVLDALANVYGLPTVASKRNIWIARRTPHLGEPEQILPVDWVGTTQHGVTATNYQVFPGDRIYVKAQRLVTLDTTLARVIAPVERLFGITLLGTSTVNQIRGRGQGF